MSNIKSEYELLTDIAQSNITKTNTNIEKHYLKGWTLTLGTTATDIGSTTYDEIVLPTSDQALQISSSNAFDLLTQILVTGYNDNFEPIQEVVSLSNVSSQLPVNLVNSYFRIKQMRVVSASTPTGDIYLYKSGAALLAGVPQLSSDFIYVLKNPDNLGTIMNLFIPPQENGYLIPNYVNCSVFNSATVVVFDFQMKYSDSANWITEFKFHVGSNENFTWPLNGISKIPNNDLSKGIDVRLQATRVGGGSSIVSASIALLSTQID